MPSEYVPEIAMFVSAVAAVAFALIVAAAVWGWGHGRKFEKKYQSTMAAVDEIAAEPGEAEQWPKSSS